MTTMTREQHDRMMQFPHPARTIIRFRHLQTIVQDGKEAARESTEKLLDRLESPSTPE
jgi:hypothetical protein